LSPIFVRPVREQLEHDRLIRYLQKHLLAKFKRKFEIGANVGDEQVAPVKLAGRTFFPDLVLLEGKKLAGLIEVETGESVNNLEAMAQWVHFSAARVPFHLYVPVTGFDAARRLCEAHHAAVAEIWTYRPSLDGFDLMRMHQDPTASARRPVAARPAAPSRPAPSKPARPAGKTPAVKSAAPARSQKPVKKAVAKPARPEARSAPKPAARKAAVSRAAVSKAAVSKTAVKKKSKR
jgi:hypothetical protein